MPSGFPSGVQAVWISSQRPAQNTAMRFRHLKTLAAVASTLNIARAARRVRLTQSSVSEQIQVLEADLRARLFDRTRRGLRLTEARQRLLDHAMPLLDLADAARAAVADAARALAGTVTVGRLETLCTTCLPPLVASFGRTYPAIALALKSAGSGDLREAVRSGGLDIAFAFGDKPDEAELASEHIAEESVAIIALSGRRLAAKAAIAPEDEAFLVRHRYSNSRLSTVPGGQQCHSHDGYWRGRARCHFRHAQPVAQSRADHRSIRDGRGVRAGIGGQPASARGFPRRLPPACGSPSRSRQGWLLSRSPSRLEAVRLGHARR